MGPAGDGGKWVCDPWRVFGNNDGGTNGGDSTRSTDSSSTSVVTSSSKNAGMVSDRVKVERRRSLRRGTEDSSGDGVVLPPLIYSIGAESAFENAVRDRCPHCEIHIFDKGEQKNLNNNTHFHPWTFVGVGQDHSFAGKKGTGKEAQDTDKMGGRAPQKYRTGFHFQNALKKLNHQNRVVDILKIDCDGCEWTIFPTVFGSIG